jgi:predicted XRE-type DNA-binding protein
MSNVAHEANDVSADPDSADAGERQVKTRLVVAINDLLKGRKLKQREAAELLGVPQPKVSALKNYRLNQFSIEKLMAFLTALNQDVEIMIRPHGNHAEAGHISVHAVQ